MGLNTKFNELLDEYDQQYQQKGLTFSLMIADIDNFKQVNDTYGHDVGDCVLKRVAQCLNSNPSNLVASRWGGEEFAVLLVCNLEEAIKISKVIVQSVSELDFSDLGIHQVTISAGVAAMDENLDLSQLFSLADRALYQAKHDGKNCVRSLM